MDLTSTLKLPLYKRYLAVFGRHHYGGLFKQALPLHLTDSKQKKMDQHHERRGTHGLFIFTYGDGGG